MSPRLPAILITLTAALAVVFLSVAIFVKTTNNDSSIVPQGDGVAPTGKAAPQPAQGSTTEPPNASDPTVGAERDYGAVRLLFLGDLMLDRHVGEKIATKGLASLLAELATSTGLLSRRYDIVMANLEGAVTNNGNHYPPVNAYDFAFAPDLISQLKDYGFNFFNLANNHILDQGERGWREALDNLNSLGFAYSGCPDAKTGDCSVRSLEINGQRIDLFGFSQVYSILDQKAVLALIASSSIVADLVIVNIHWGKEYEHIFSPSQQSLGRAMVDVGADVVIGHHPHVVQGMEIYNNRPIFYSLGNFIFDQYFSLDTQEGLAVEAAVYDDGMEFFLHPLKSKSSVVTEMDEKGAKEFFSRFIGWSDEENVNAKCKSQNGKFWCHFTKF